MVRTELPSAPWQHLAADLLGPLPSGDYVFVVVNYYSRFFEMEFTKSTTSEKIVSMLSKIFVTHGLPLSLRTDNGSQFVCDYFKKYLEENGIEHRRTTPLWPQANGEIERQNRIILKRLRIAQAEGRNWRSEMDIPLTNRVRGPYRKLRTEFFPPRFMAQARSAGAINRRGKK